MTTPCLEEIGDSVNLLQFNRHLKKYTGKWYTRKAKGVSDEKRATGVQ